LRIAKLIEIKDTLLKHLNLICGEPVEMHVGGLMPWDFVFSRWASLAHSFCRDFPHLDPDAISRFRGNYRALVSYLADTHDLTHSEAANVLSDWIERRAAPLCQ
jgi:hypothetical protein